MPFFFNDVPSHCLFQAASEYHVPVTLILSILKTENGRNGTVHRNTDGSFDYGPMQINSRWLHRLASYGITENDLRNNPCVNVHVGSWILAQGMTENHVVDSERTEWLRRTYFLKGIGNYNSHTPAYNKKYAQRVLRWYVFFEHHL